MGSRAEGPPSSQAASLQDNEISSPDTGRNYDNDAAAPKQMAGERREVTGCQE